MRNFMREKKIYCGKKYLEIDIIPRTEIQEKTVKGKRRKRIKVTMPKQNNLNEKNSRRLFVQTINANFGAGDLHVSLTYSDKYLPSTLEEAHKIVVNYFRRISYKRKKTGLAPLKYALVTEYGMEEEKIIRIHHHIIMNGGLTRDEVEEQWSYKKRGERNGESLGWVNSRRLQPNENGLEAISMYVTKIGNKKNKKSWSSSRNLVRPEWTKNDTKYSKRKIEKLAKENDICFWEQQYKNYRITKVEKIYEEQTGWHIYLKMWKKDEEDLQ